MRFVLQISALVLVGNSATAQTPFTCSTYGSSSVCFSPPLIQYGVFDTIQAYGSTREEACLKYATAKPRSDRGPLVGVRLYGGTVLFHCIFLFTSPDGKKVEGIDGDNREIKVCPINQVMWDTAGKYDKNRYAYPGALYLTPPQWQSFTAQ